MNQQHIIDVLNRLYVIHERSLPVYLSYARPWALHGEEATCRVLEQIAASQRELATRVGAMIDRMEGQLDPGEFPLEFTDYHDLSCDFLVRKMIERQRQAITQIEQCVLELRDVPAARALAEECLGAAQAHLEMLEELVQPDNGNPSVRHAHASG